ncbi:DUF6766 family protein [Nonomuraea sp. NPDC004354]
MDDLLFLLEGRRESPARLMTDTRHSWPHPSRDPRRLGQGQSEYLQFLLFILATVWLVQRGSPESKERHLGAGLAAIAGWNRPRCAQCLLRLQQPVEMSLDDRRTG